MKILFVVHQYLPRHRAGTEVYAHSLAKELAGRHRVLVYCHEPALDGGAVPAMEETYDGVPVRRVAAFLGRPPSPGRAFIWSYRNPRIAQDYRATLAAFQPDVVHVQHLKDLSMNILGETARRGIPLVLTLHDYWALCPNAQCLRPDGRICAGTHGRLECGLCAVERLGQPALRPTAPALAPLFWVRQGAIRRGMRHVRRFIAPSAFLRARYIAAGYPAEKIVQWENGLDLARIRQALAEPRTSFRGHYAYIGSLAWQKGVHVLVEAFRRLGDTGAELKIWGNPDTFPAYTRQLQRLAAGCPRISFAGELDEMHIGEALAWADYLVVPSLWWENSPVTIQEAYAAGVPVIASNVGALAEKVRHERSGLLFAPGDVAHLERALRRTWAEPALWERLRAGLPPVVPMAEHAALMEGLYLDMLREGDHASA